MSLRRKVKKLDDISSIISRCKNNTGIYESLLKEKEKLEREIFISVAGNNKKQTKICFEDHSEASPHLVNASSKEKHRKNKTVLGSADKPKLSSRNKTKDLENKTHCPDYVISTDVHELLKSSKELPAYDDKRGRKKNNKTAEHKRSKQRQKHKSQSTRDTLSSTGQSRSDASVSSRSLTERSKHVKQFTKEEIEQMSAHNKKKREIHSRSVRNLPVSQLNQTNKDSPRWKQVNSIAINKMNNWEPHQGNPVSSSVPIATSISSRLMKLREEDHGEENYRSPTHPNHTPSSRPEKCRPSLESDVRLQDGTRLLKGEVVFKFDLDEIRPKPQDKSLSSMFRRKFFRSKTPTTQSMATQTHSETFSQATQAYQWKLPGYLHHSTTQTSGPKTGSKSSQTPLNAQRESSSQTRIKSKTVATQYLPDDAQSKDVTTQTEDEDHSVWGGRVSLDRLVQCRANRRKNATFIKNDDVIEEENKIEEAVNPVVKEEQANTRTIPIRSYSWSQSEKFVKVFVSHNGIHLPSTKKIYVRTNGLDVRLRITREERNESSNENNNNNNDKTHDAKESFYELNIDELCHQVSQMSYSIQPDMITLVLRKASAAFWHNLTPNDENKHLATTPKVYV